MTASKQNDACCSVAPHNTKAPFGRKLETERRAIRPVVAGESVGREGIEPPQPKAADLQSAELTTCSICPSVVCGDRSLGTFDAHLHHPDNQCVDDRTIRIAVLLSAHVIFLSAAALRIVRGQRRHLLRTEAPWWIQYYPPLVWLPFVAVYAQVAWFPA